MADDMKDRQESGTSAPAINRRRHVAWLLMLIADAGLLAWGAMAALVPERLPGPGSAPILAAGYEGFTRRSWSELADTSPMTAEFISAALPIVWRIHCGVRAGGDRHHGHRLSPWRRLGMVGVTGR